MASNPNKKRVIVDLSGDWEQYQKGHESFDIIGVVSRGSEAPGALAIRKINGEYVQLNNNVVTKLMQNKVKAAISSQEKTTSS